MPIKLHSVRVSFPLWEFLTQPLFTPTKVFFNPFQFQHHYHVQLLERCWECDSVQLLERCWLKEWEMKHCSN